MLELRKIKKDYVNGDNVTHALKGLSVNFRRNEFVSILGPSGCGKTTTLNIIGGLDRYTSGDLIIEGKSTKNYSDRDWDTYRNHSIGFVFQTYNLIAHLNILGNVELALTIGGVSKEERRTRAMEALKKVGLDDIAKKKPNQLSGGQMQRVAIARALVNNPEILLADEPTGALDSETSIQIMDLLKEVANDRLVIMVTHNPELAKKYSSRIITMKDGELTSDTNPFDGKDETKPVKEPASKKAKMKLRTAFLLSGRNLLSKAKRTALVCVAGSIGIIGVSTVLAVSTGVRGYINSMQDDMLSGNPVTVTESSMDLGSLLNFASSLDRTEAVVKSIEDGKININYMVEFLSNAKNNFEAAAIRNDLNQDYVDFINNMPAEYYSAIKKGYGLGYKPNIFTDVQFSDPIGKVNQVSLKEVEDAYVSIVKQTAFSKYSSMISMFTTTFESMPENEEYVLSQYDIINEGGYVCKDENEMMLVVSKDSELTDIFLAQVGYYSEDQFIDVIDKYVNGKEIELQPDRFTYEELLNKEFYYYPNDSIFYEPETPGLFPYSYKGSFENDEELPAERQKIKITAILRAKENVSYGCLETGFITSPKFDRQFVTNGKESKIVNYINSRLDYYNSLTPEQQKALPVGTLLAASLYNYDYAYEGEVTHVNFAPAFSVINYGDTSSGTASIFASLLGNLTVDAQFEATSRTYGGIDRPNDFSFYPLSFDEKHLVTDYLDQWNGDSSVAVKRANGDIEYIESDARKNVRYNDNLEIVINLINNMIQIITIALVSFTSLSLVVSTVMIGIITYVSVVERVKEIGIIRSLGGRKMDVSNLFNVETFIIGSISGVFGILVTFGLSAIINLVINMFANVGAIVYLPWNYTLIIIGVSILLTLISGLIPARAAAHKDPVVALRIGE